LVLLGEHVGKVIDAVAPLERTDGGIQGNGRRRSAEEGSTQQQ
jgi:hypothetical protein